MNGAARTPRDSTPSEAGSCPFRHVLIVTNPISGRGRGVKAVEELAVGFSRVGAKAEVYRTTARGDAFTKLRTLDASGPASPAGRVDLVVSVGGDGTLREVLDGLVDPMVPVGLLPLGTANVLAKELGLPRDVHHALDILTRGNVREVDVAQVGGQLSVLMTGIGIDARAVAEVERVRRGPITKAHYVTAVLRALRGYTPPELRVTLDGEELDEPCGFVIVGNARHYAGFLRLDADASMSDGLFEVYLFPTGKFFELTRAFFRGVFKHLPGGGVTVRRAKEILVRANEPTPYQVDGDLGGDTPIEIRVAPNQYRLVVP